MPQILFVTHPEVVIDPSIPVPDWPLSELGRRRMKTFAEALRPMGVTAVWSSTERKARDGAEILGATLGISPKVEATLGENNRDATGYIAPPEFWQVVEEFFANPARSIRGWETAADAQTRIVGAVSKIASTAPQHGPTVIVSHGGVGRLLTAHLQQVKIGHEDRPENPGGGCFLTIESASLNLSQSWRDIGTVCHGGSNDLLGSSWRD